MPQKDIPLSISAPGFYGLNKQQSGGILPVGWATEAHNCVIDTQGRVASRMGSQNLNASTFTGTPRTIYEYLDGVGNSVLLFSAGNKINKIVSGTVTDVSGTITTPTADNWKFVTFNGKCVGVQASHNINVLATTSGTFANIVLSGTQQPTTSVNDICSAFGRLWALDGGNLKYSDLLVETAWNGVFDLSKYWRTGEDEPTAIAEFNGYLVVFGKNNIIVFNNAYDPATTMQIVENIGGVGCIARDSVQNIGTDILFLSNSGVRSLSRTVQEKSMPVNDITKNVRDYLLSYSSSETKSLIKSFYSPKDGCYVVSFPTQTKSFWVDLRSPNPDGSARVTEWGLAPTALATDKSSNVYFGKTSYVSQMQGYKDDVTSAGTGGTSYQWDWTGTWTDMGSDVSPYIKIPKKVSVLMGGVAGSSAQIKWAFDYNPVYSTSLISFSGNPAKYGVSKYTIGVYSGALNFNTAKTPMNRSGQVMQLG